MPGGAAGAAAPVDVTADGGAVVAEEGAVAASPGAAAHASPSLFGAFVRRAPTGAADSNGEGATGPVALPAKLQAPDLAALAAGAHESLAAAVHAALRSAAAKAAPGLCAGAKPRVDCGGGGDSGEGAVAGAAKHGGCKICVPDCSGNCTIISGGDCQKCIDIPGIAAKLPRAPKLPALPRIPKISLPRPPCGRNEAMNLTATLKALPSALFGHAAGGAGSASGGEEGAVAAPRREIAIGCAPCPEGTVAKQPAFFCTLCPPG